MYNMKFSCHSVYNKTSSKAVCNYSCGYVSTLIRVNRHHKSFRIRKIEEKYDKIHPFKQSNRSICISSIFHFNWIKTFSIISVRITFFIAYILHNVDELQSATNTPRF